MGITQDELQNRLKTQGIDQATLDTAKSFQPLLQKHIDSIVSHLADHMMTIDGLKDVVRDSVADKSYHKVTAEHWLQLFSGTIDQAYFDSTQERGTPPIPDGHAPTLADAQLQLPAK